MWSAPPTAWPRCRGATLSRCAVQGPYGCLPAAALRIAAAIRRVPAAPPPLDREAACRLDRPGPGSWSGLGPEGREDAGFHACPALYKTLHD